MWKTREKARACFSARRGPDQPLDLAGSLLKFVPIYKPLISFRVMVADDFA
jgi:hypothetical protein